MPELIEVETYRRQAEIVLGRLIAEVVAPDAWYLKGTTAADLARAVEGRTVTGCRRIGKLLVLDLDGGGWPPAGSGRVRPVPEPPRGPAGAAGQDEAAVRLGLRFGMTGRLLVDGAAAIDRLLYASARHEPTWDRFGLRFAAPGAGGEGGGGGSRRGAGSRGGRGRGARLAASDRGGDLVVRDPRRLGGVSLDPDEGRLGVDAARVTAPELARALRTGRARSGHAASGHTLAGRVPPGAGGRPLKAALLDQSRIAGLGNLLADEICWRAGLDPARATRSLDDGDIATLATAIHDTLAELTHRGGSHTGDLQPARVPGGRCPRDGTTLLRRKIGGRTTVSCPRHQR